MVPILDGYVGSRVPHGMADLRVGQLLLGPRTLFRLSGILVEVVVGGRLSDVVPREKGPIEPVTLDAPTGWD